MFGNYSIEHPTHEIKQLTFGFFNYWLWKLLLMYQIVQLTKLQWGQIESIKKQNQTTIRFFRILVSYNQ